MVLMAFQENLEKEGKRVHKDLKEHQEYPDWQARLVQLGREVPVV